MSPYKGDYSALSQNVDKTDHDLFTRSEGALGFLRVNKHRKFQISTIFLCSTTFLLLVVVAIQTGLLLRSGRRSLSKGKVK